MISLKIKGHMLVPGFYCLYKACSDETILGARTRVPVLEPEMVEPTDTVWSQSANTAIWLSEHAAVKIRHDSIKMPPTYSEEIYSI